MSEMDQKRRTRLLSDAPADEDAFGGHGRVAEALDYLIRDEDGGKAIALEGPFGSGKTTVIRLLQEKLDDVNNRRDVDTRIFIYDAWEHQGDPLRRSFIESLIEFVRDEEYGWAEKKAWEKDKERLARRQETTEKTTKPKLTSLGRRVAVTLFMSPLGLLIVNNFISDDDGSLQTSSPEVFLWILGLIIFVIPLILIGCALLGGEDPFYVLVKKTHQYEEIKTIRTPDPTTIEFQDIFKRIISETLSMKDRRLIVVVDNLDRLPPEQAISTWATMRTFFRSKEEDLNGPLQRFWLIVPINFGALQRIFKDSAQEGDETTVRPQSNGRKESNITGKVTLGEEFARKTFDTVFRVAPPVLDDWQKFMKDQLEEAFIYDDEGRPTRGEFHSVYRLYRLRRVSKGAVPTPREIKVFINRISALYRQWGVKIELPILALYQLRKSEIEANVACLKSETFLEMRERSELTNDHWQKDLAALHFNVNRERAIHVLIGEDVQEALETGNEKQLNELTVTSGFHSVLDEAISEICQGDDQASIARAAKALSAIDVDVRYLASALWERLRKGVIKSSSWFPRTKEEGQGIVSVILNTPQDYRSQFTINILQNISKVEINGGGERDETERWVQGILPLLRELREDVEIVKNNFHLPHGWLVFLTAVTRLSKEDDAVELAPFLVPDPGMEAQELDSYLREVISDDEFRIANPDALQLSKNIETVAEVQWTETSEVLINKLSSFSNLDEPDIAQLLTLTLILSAVYNDQSMISRLNEKNTFHIISSIIDSNSNQESIRVVALCFTIRMMHDGGEPISSNKQGVKRGHQYFKRIAFKDSGENDLVEAIADTVAEHRIADRFLASSKFEDVKKLTSRVVSVISSKEQVNRLFDDESFMTYSDFIYNAIEEDRFKELVLEADEDKDLSCGLSDLDEDSWIELLKKEGRIVDIALHLGDESGLRLPPAFADALLTHAEWMIVEQSAPTELKNKAEQLLGLLSPEIRSRFLRQLQRLLLEEVTKRNNINAVLSMYGELIQQSEKTTVETEDWTKTVDDGFGSLVRRRVPDELEWLFKVLDNQPEINASVGTETWMAFKQIVAEEYENADDETQASLRPILELLDIEPEDSEAES